MTMMTERAFLVAYIELSHGKLQFVGADIFSEPWPEQAGKNLCLQATLMTARGTSFGAAGEALGAALLARARANETWRALVEVIRAKGRNADWWLPKE